MLNQSSLLSFIDEEYDFTLHFFEGQKLIHDLALLHHLNGPGFAYFRQLVLGLQPMISFLKAGESFGFYLDSENPYFRFKLETNFYGKVRTLLIPENFSLFPEELTGKARLIKTFPYDKSPYTSVMALENSSFHQIMNEFLKSSYQMQAQVLISDQVDQCLMLMKLPARSSSHQATAESVMSLKEYLLIKQKSFHQLLQQELTSIDQIKAAVTQLSPGKIRFLGERSVVFECNCSEKKMLHNLSIYVKSSQDNLFAQQDSVELKCDFCKKMYVIDQQTFDQYNQENSSLQ